MNTRLISITSTALLSSLASAQNYLQNPGFESWQQNDNGGYTYSYTGDNFGEGASSGASPWLFYNFTDGTTTSERATPPAGLANSGNYSDYITADAAGNGIRQETETEIAENFYPDVYGFVSGWVYVTSGTVGIGYLDASGNANPFVLASTSTENQWVYLSSSVSDQQAISFMIVSVGGPASFYADNMDAEPTPEPAAFAVLGLGAFALLRRRRRRAKA